MVGLLRPTAGRAEILGLDAWSDSVRIHARTGYIPGDAAFNDRLTGREVVTFFAGLRGHPGDVAAAVRLAERLDLDLGRRIHEMSRGNGQKVAIVQAFMSAPDLLVLDEPTSGLDPIVQVEFQALLRETVERGGTVLLSSHVLDEVQRSADRVGMIRSSRPWRAAPWQTCRSPNRTWRRCSSPSTGSRPPMLHSVVVRATRDQRRSLLVWTVAIIGLVVMYAAVYPSIKGNTAYSRLMDQMPEAYRALFGVGSGADLTTAAGYLNTELLSFIGPLLVLLYAIAAGSGAVAGPARCRVPR